MKLEEKFKKCGEAENGFGGPIFISVIVARAEGMVSDTCFSYNLFTFFMFSEPGSAPSLTQGDYNLLLIFIEHLI